MERMQLLDQSTSLSAYLHMTPKRLDHRDTPDDYTSTGRIQDRGSFEAGYDELWKYLGFLVSCFSPNERYVSVFQWHHKRTAAALLKCWSENVNNGTFWCEPRRSYGFLGCCSWFWRSTWLRMSGLCNGEVNVHSYPCTYPFIPVSIYSRESASRLMVAERMYVNCVGWQFSLANVKETNAAPSRFQPPEKFTYCA